VYTFTKLRVSVDEYDGSTKFDAKNEQKTKAVDRRASYFFAIYCKIKATNKVMNIIKSCRADVTARRLVVAVH